MPGIEELAAEAYGHGCPSVTVPVGSAPRRPREGRLPYAEAV
ncbi:hypothetical protein ACFVGN_10220 [Streptomyces sp. NPDC057757]